MTKVSDLGVLENEVFLCTSTNSTRRSLEFLMNKVSQVDIPSEDTASAEKLNRMKFHLEGLLEEIEPKDNYRVNWSISWAGVIIGLIAAGVAFLLVVAIK